MNVYTLALVSTILISFMYCTQSQATGVGKFEEATCPFELPENLVEGENFIFGYVTVPEQHSQPKGPTIRLAVARFPRHSDSPEPDLRFAEKQNPLLLFTGGPGSSSMQDLVPSLAGEAGALLLPKRDGVVIELRGLYYSEPNLVCQERYDMQLAIIDQNLSSEEMMTRLLESMRASRERFEGEGINLAAYNNVETAADIAMVMTTLGYDKFNVFGNSAGTILAQHLMRDYPERLRSVSLSSPAPLGTSIFQSSIPNSIKTLRQLFERFSEDEERNAAYPNLEANFLGLLEELNANPVTIPVKDNATGKTANLLLNGDRLAQWVFVKLYQSPQIIVDIGRITTGDYTSIQSDPGIFFPMSKFSYGLSHSISFSEFIGPAPEDTAVPESYSTFSDAVAALGFGPDYMRRGSEVWGVPPLDEYARKPVIGDVPTLILCGEFDQVCPPRYGELLAEGLSNAYVYTFPGVSHSPIDAGMGPVLMVFGFIENPTKAPDASCLEKYELKFVLE